MIVSLTPLPDMAPVPRVEIRVDPMLVFDGGGPGTSGAPLLDGGAPGATGAPFEGGDPGTIMVDVPEGTDRVTVWRRSEGRAVKVRGAVERSFLGSVGLLDFEAGFDTDSTYELECFSGGDPVGRVTLGTTVLPWSGDPNGVLVQQPLDPSLNAVVVNLEGSWPQVVRDAPSELVHTQGRSLPTLVSSGPRRGVEGLEVDFGVTDRVSAERLWGTLGSEERPQLPVWLVRSPRGILPRVFFGRVGALAEVDVDTRTGGGWTRFQASLDEVAPPAPALVVSPLTYFDLDAVFASYDARDEAFASYNEMDAAWEYAGAAGGV